MLPKCGEMLRQAILASMHRIERGPKDTLQSSSQILRISERRLMPLDHQHQTLRSKLNTHFERPSRKRDVKYDQKRHHEEPQPEPKDLIKAAQPKTGFCKFFQSGNCKRGDSCPYIHQKKKLPCKYINTLGVCLFGDTCTYSHERLKVDEIDQFIESNVDFIDAVFMRKQATNLGRFYHDFKKRQAGSLYAISQQNMSNALIPQSLKGAGGPPYYSYPFERVGSLPGFFNDEPNLVPEIGREQESLSTNKMGSNPNTGGSTKEDEFDILSDDDGNQLLQQSLNKTLK